MCFQYAMNYWNIGARNFVYSNVACVVFLIDGVGKEKEITAIESWFHGSTTTQYVVNFNFNLRTGEDMPQDDDYRGFRVRNQTKSLPDHKTRCQYRSEVKDLEKNLSHQKRTQ